MDNYLAEANKRRAELDASVHDFLAAGGKIDQIEAPWERVPTAEELARKVAPYGKFTIAKKVETSSHKAELVRQATELAKTLSVSAAARHMGMARPTLQDLAKANGITFRRVREVLVTPEEAAHEAATVERVKALRDIGVSLSRCAEQCGMGYSKFQRFLRRHQITYFAQAAGKPARQED